ncbi:MAG: T9SS type A sorting domain-containing protein [Ignavibacteria bacterium]|nr:T9SS type A sorting domain-containing protein [Ignavibacteria bacterium]
MKYERIHKNMLMAVYLLLFASLPAFAQIVIYNPIDIMAKIDSGTIQVEVIPEFNIGSIEKVFDGNPYTNAGIIGSDSISITLISDEELNFTKTKVFFWNNGNWNLEVANSYADLINHTGSYQLLVDNRNFTFFNWDSLTFQPQQVKVIRLSSVVTDTSIYIGEWTIEKSITLTSLVTLPYPPKVIPGATLKLKAQPVDEYNNLYNYNFTEPLVWSSSNPSVATIDDGGNLTGINLGVTTITVATESNSISGSVTARVITDFESENAETKIVKVALVIQDPIIYQFDNKRIHEHWSWPNPFYLTEQVRNDLNAASDSVMIFEVVETHNDQEIFTVLDSSYMTIDQLAYYFQNSQTLYGELKYIAEVEGRIHYDYNGMVDYYDLDTKRNNGEIDEVWVYCFPFGGMYESQLMGPGAFWWNSPPLPHPGLEKTLSVMGWNYERGVAEALHSVGHRFESALWHAYKRWDLTQPELNNWEKFTSIDLVLPGKGHVGNIHYPVNGTSDYNYDNTQNVTTYADNWIRYPYLFNETRTVNCLEWNCSQRNYMIWWFNHLPRYKGVTDSILNNWWHYAVDYYEAVELANNTPPLSVKDQRNPLISDYFLSQNYPNPFNPGTTIEFSIAAQEKVTIKVFDILGREVSVLLNEEKPAGSYSIVFNAKNLASGVYFYSIRSKSFIQTKKMILLK